MDPLLAKQDYRARHDGTAPEPRGGTRPVPQGTGIMGSALELPNSHGIGGTECSSPTLSQFWSVPGSPHAWNCPCTGALCQQLPRGWRVGDVTLVIAKSWMGWEQGNRDPTSHWSHRNGVPTFKRILWEWRSHNCPMGIPKTTLVPQSQGSQKWGSCSHRDPMGMGVPVRIPVLTEILQSHWSNSHRIPMGLGSHSQSSCSHRDPKSHWSHRSDYPVRGNPVGMGVPEPRWVVPTSLGAAFEFGALPHPPKPPQRTPKSALATSME